MVTLLHLDTSLNGEASVSREVAATFRREWDAQHPNGTVIYRDLSAEPLPHLDHVAHSAGAKAAADHSPEEAAAFALRDQLARELESADVVLIGAPMYNYGITSTLKSWIDHIFMVGRTIGETPSAAGTPTVVVASRGGSYGPGTPREGWDHAQTYLETALGKVLGLEVEFVVPELTLARTVPALAGLIDKADASRAKAHEEAAAKAKALAARFTS